YTRIEVLEGNAVVGRIAHGLIVVIIKLDNGRSAVSDLGLCYLEKLHRRDSGALAKKCIQNHVFLGGAVGDAQSVEIFSRKSKVPSRVWPYRPVGRSSRLIKEHVHVRSYRIN